MKLNGFRPALLAATCASLAIAAPLVAAPDWLAPQDISGAGADAFIPEVGVDAAGTATAVWSRLDPLGHSVVQTATRPAGAAGWTLPATDLSLPDGDLPEVAVNAAGAAVAIWARFDGTDTIIEAARRPTATAAWSAPVAVTAHDATNEGTPLPDVGEATGPEVGIDASGDAVLNWVRNDGVSSVAQAAVWPAGTGTPGATHDLSASAAGADAFLNAVAVHGGGDAVVVWAQSAGATSIIRSRALTDGAWSAGADDLSTPGDDASTPQVAIGPGGEAVAVWATTGAQGTFIESRVRQAGGGGWGAAAQLTADEASGATDPQIAVDGAGVATAVWSKAQAAGSILVQSKRRAAGALGTWAATPDTLSADGADALLPQLALSDGGAVVAWSRSDGANSVIQTTHRLAGASAWSAPQSRSAAGQDADSAKVAVDASGDAVAVWTRFDGTNPVVQAARFDATKPVVSAVNVPTNANAGDLVQMSLVATDAWSPLAAATWTFGDGQQATGDIVHHTYAAGGTYTVTVTQADSVGNAVTTQRQITVAPIVTPATAVVLSKLSARCAARHGKLCQPRITVTLSRAATVTILLKRDGKVVGTLTRAGKRGVNTFALPARVGKHTIRGGKYRASIRAASGGRTLTTGVMTVR